MRGWHMVFALFVFGSRTTNTWLTWGTWAKETATKLRNRKLVRTEYFPARLLTTHPPVGDCGWRSQANCNVSGEKLVKGTERGQTVSLTAQNGRATGGSRSVPLAPLAILPGR